jgi:hypothetical protein
MARLVTCVALLLTIVSRPHAADQEPAVQPSRFAGTWVGTQSWAIANPPPGARSDQPVTLIIEVVEGRITGSMTPFLGGEDGATFVDATIVGEQLRASAVVGVPRLQAAARGDAGPPQGAGRGRRGGGPANWKDAIAVTFTFRNDGITMTGAADIKLGDVPWLAFNYDLGRKRSRY